ncbi:MAG: LacI family transcriptional regulator [Victivallales bacterium]|jgi:DNA-binding LacI/PurR family transcriptional regulator|nr:LacI family transcriptional regulator [Victivallales bacterium]
MSISEIAEKLKVSTATVSNALSGRGRMRKDLRMQILSYADQIGFRPNVNASRLRSGQSKQILFCAQLESDNDFAFYHAIFIHFLTNILIRHGYDLVIHPYFNTDKDREIIVQKALNRGVDAILMQTDGTTNIDLLKTLAGFSLPIINYDSSSDAMESAVVDTFTNSFMDSLLYVMRQKKYPPDSELIIIKTDAVLDDRFPEDFCRVALLQGIKTPPHIITVPGKNTDFKFVWERIVAEHHAKDLIVCCRLEPYFDTAYHALGLLPANEQNRIHLFSTIHKIEIEKYQYQKVICGIFDFQEIAEKMVEKLLKKLNKAKNTCETQILPGRVVDLPCSSDF